VFVLVLVAISAPWALVPGDNADGAGMRAHLHAVWESRELLYDDEYAQLRMSPLFAFVTEQGLVSNHWPIGATFVQAPGWLLGRGAGALLAEAPSAHVSARAATWDIPLLGLRSWAMLVLVGLSVWLTRWLEPLVGRRSTVLAVAATLLGTPLLYYAAESPERPHLWGFCVVTVAVLRWFGAVERAQAAPEQARSQVRTSLELAVYVGLATAIRPQLAMLALLVAHERWVASEGLAWRARLALLGRHGLASAGVFAVWPALVVGMQLWMYGGLGDYRGEVSHHLRAFLLSTHHGALVWCPVIVIGLLGLAIGAARRERGALLLLGLLFAQIWLDAGTREIQPHAVLGTRTWTGGTSFGPRKLLDALPLLLPGVVWLHRWLTEQDPRERRRWQLRLGIATGLAVIPTVLLLAAAWLDPRVCSDVLDGDRLLNAMSLGFDPHAWTRMWAIRAVPIRVTATVATIVGIPLALLVLVALVRRPPTWTWTLVLGYGLVANLWILALMQRTTDIVAADPARIEHARGRLDPAHEAVVRQIPAQQALLDVRLGPD
jgi:hypothetical protein